MKTEKILLAGATGYLGQYILAELLKKNTLPVLWCAISQK